MEKFLFQLPSKQATLVRHDVALEELQSASTSNIPQEAGQTIDMDNTNTSYGEESKKNKKKITNRNIIKIGRTDFLGWYIRVKMKYHANVVIRLIITCNLNHIKRHENTLKHKKLFKKSISTPKLTSLQEVKKVNTLSKKSQIAEYKLLMFLHEHNLPFLLMDHLPKMLCSAFPDSDIIKHLKCSRTKATEVTKDCLVKEALEEITAETQKSFYSLIVDETTDVSTKKSLAIVIRYHNGTTYVKLAAKISDSSRIGRGTHGRRR